MTKAKILIVEDDSDTAEYLELHLIAKDYNVTGIASSGEEAIARISEDVPDLVIMDIKLEGKMDGIETSHLIQKQFSIPTLYLTAFLDEKLFDRAKITEPFAYMLKPFNERELELSIEIALYRFGLEEKLRESEAHLKEAQQIGQIGSWNWDIVTNQLTWTDQIFRIFGLAPQAFGATYEAFLECIHPDDRTSVETAVNHTLNDGSEYDITHRIVLPSGDVRFVRERGATQFDTTGTGTPVRMQGTVQDVTALRRSEDEIKKLAYYDHLTGLPNRHLFFDRLDQEIAQSQRESHQFALLVIDLDGFKAINDNLGHQTGDALLKEVASRLSKEIREVDTLSRVGGDEFIIILHGLKQQNDAKAVADKLIRACAQTCHINTHDVSIGCSIGVSVYPDNGADGDTLIKHADEAMYQAKRAGKNQHTFYLA